MPARRRPHEITDLIVDPLGRSARVDDVVDALAATGQRKAARIVARLPRVGDELDADRLREVMLDVHCDLQRLEEELQMPRVVASRLYPLVERLRKDARGEPLTVIDLGCGLGYLTRWLSRTGILGDDVAIVGIDRDATLLDRARGLAATEGINGDFRVGDAFDIESAAQRPERTVVISSGLLHHLPLERLPAFFAVQQKAGLAAFAHWDLTPTRWARIGAWLYHRSRARTAIARHDGVVSTARAYPAATLLAAARAGAPEYTATCHDGRSWVPNPLNVLRPIIGVGPRLEVA